ncbi:MAG: ferrous iron transport protein B [Oscillospiraceae bacterium]|nr:ferrous iron transport protein B [Oscillospiraceae bacterium]
MEIRIALAGNPNCGKTTLFNALTGSDRFVGNWPGVTVEKKECRLKGHKDVIITDLPGIYSLSPYTLEEVITRNYLTEECPDAILNIVDGTNLERNLYLTTQLTELGIPVVVAVNMTDVVRKRGDEINTGLLSEKLGCEVVEISALKGMGINEASAAAIKAAVNKTPSIPRHRFCGCVEHAVARIEDAVSHNVPEERRRWYAVKIFERDDKVLEMLNIPADIKERIENYTAEAEKEKDDDSESIVTNERYIYIASIIKDCYKKKNKGKLTVSDKIDRIVTNRILALPVFAAVMFVVYYVSITTVGTWATDWANDGVFGEGWSLFGLYIPGVPVIAENILTAVNCADWLQSLIIDGIIGGVGAVLGFVPQMLVLFIFLAFLEACGYMARIAFVTDRIFRKFGLSGKSFIPMLIGTGCGVPGIMASRTIENERDRRMTIMTTTFIPCGAKLPIIAFIAGALFDNAGWVAVSAYFIGAAAIIVSGIMLKKTRMFAGDPAPFVMELPDYRMPTAGNILRSVWERGLSFIKKAGTVILLSTIVLWFLMGFGVENGSFGMVEEIDNSVLAKIGSGIAWIFAPLGWGDWKAAVAAVTGLIAKENIVATYGSLYHFAGEISENGNEIWGGFAAEFSALAGYSFLIFNLLCAPCFAAVGAIKREMNNPVYTAFAVTYQCVFAYAVSLAVYQFGLLFTGGVNVMGLIFAVAVTAFMIYMLVRPYKESDRFTRNVKVKT